MRIKVEYPLNSHSFASFFFPSHGSIDLRTSSNISLSFKFLTFQIFDKKKEKKQVGISCIMAKNGPPFSVHAWPLSCVQHCIKRKPRPVVGASLLLLTALLTGVLIKVPPPGKLNVAVEGPGERRAKKILGKAKIVRTLIDIGARAKFRSRLRPLPSPPPHRPG